MKKAASRQQFNVYLSREIVRSIKHRCIEEGIPLYQLVEKVFADYLEKEVVTEGEREPAEEEANAGTTTFFYAGQYEASCAYYTEALRVEPSQGKNWCEFNLSPGAKFALHRKGKQMEKSINLPQFSFHFRDLREALPGFTENGGKLTTSITEVAHGAYAFVEDPEGRKLELGEYRE